MEQAKQRIAWLEYLVNLGNQAINKARMKIDNLIKEKENLLQQWEKTMKELKHWKEQASIYLKKYQDEKLRNIALERENKALKALLTELKVELDKKPLVKEKIIEVEKPIIKEIIREVGVEKENVLNNTVETSFDIKLKDVRDCLKQKFEKYA